MTEVPKKDDDIQLEDVYEVWLVRKPQNVRFFFCYFSSNNLRFIQAIILVANQ